MGEIHRLESGWVTNPCGFESYHFRIMVTLSATPISAEIAEENELSCDAVDYASILKVEQNNDEGDYSCTLPPTHALALNPAEDITIPFFLCDLHMGALKIGIGEGFGIDTDIFGG
jgi:hypothetical protein